MNNLNEKKIAILATNGFEESELISPMTALKNKGAQVHIVSLEPGRIKGWKDGYWAGEIDVDKVVGEVSSSDYNALVIPGGVINPDKLRTSIEAVKFVRSFFDEHKPVASICHGPQMLIEAGVVDGRRLTSFKSIATDLKNAGAHWEDSEVVVDEGLVTSRSPRDLAAFNNKLIEEVAEGKHAEQTV